MIWCIKTYIIAYVKTHTQKKIDLLSIMSNLQPNCCLKFDFQKVSPQIGPGVTAANMPIIWKIRYTILSFQECRQRRN